MKNTYELFALIGQNMKSIRTNIIGKSQEKMAEDTDMSRSFISHIESPNVDTGISLDTLFFLAQKYNFDIRKFFDGYEKLMDKENEEDSEYSIHRIVEATSNNKTDFMYSVILSGNEKKMLPDYIEKGLLWLAK